MNCKSYNASYFRNYPSKTEPTIDKQTSLSTLRPGQYNNWVKYYTLIMKQLKSK